MCAALRAAGHSRQHRCRCWGPGAAVRFPGWRTPWGTSRGEIRRCLSCALLLRSAMHANGGVHGRGLCPLPHAMSNTITRSVHLPHYDGSGSGASGPLAPSRTVSAQDNHERFSWLRVTPRLLGHPKPQHLDTSAAPATNPWVRARAHMAWDTRRHSAV